MTIIELPDELAERLRVVAEAQDDGDLNRYAVAALWEAADRAEGLREGQALLTGPAHSLDEADERFRRKYNLPDLSHLSREELAAEAEAALARADPKKVAEAERLGLI